MKNERDRLARGEITQLPWARKTNASFGIQFPTSALKGDTYIKTDVVPNRIYKYSGKDWMLLDKSLVDHYTYDITYIDHVIAKIASGEYDQDLLDDNQREQVAERLKLNNDIA